MNRKKILTPAEKIIKSNISFNTALVDTMQKYADRFGKETRLGGHRELFDSKYSKNSPIPPKKYFDFVHEGDNFDNFMKSNTDYFVQLGERKSLESNNKNETDVIIEFLNIYTKHKKDKTLIDEIWKDLKILFALSIRCCGKTQHE